MAELRLVGVSEDGQRLVLGDDFGDEHTIAIDERLRAGVNGHLSRLGQLTMALESRISPREIQERVRGGESAEQVAISAGVPLDRVLRFVGPVLREREHVADQARRARLGGANGPAPLLADVVARAAARQGVEPDDVAWDSARREDHSWVVIVRWPDDSSAMWGLDLSRRQATALDAMARRVSGLGDESVEALRRSLDLDGEADSDAAGPDAAEADSGQGDGPEHNVRLFVRRAVAPVSDAPEAQAPEAPDRPVRDADLDTDDADDSDDAEPARSAGTPSPPPAGGRSGRSSRRARVPKWDDIMFGPKSTD
jgi:hypothetical protein